MNSKKTYISAFFVAAMLMTACSSGNTVSAPGTSTERSAETSVAVKPADGKKLGERFKFSTRPQNELYLTVEAVEFFSSCPNGSWEDEGISTKKLEENQQFVNIVAVVENLKLQDPLSKTIGMGLRLPTVITADGFTVDSEFAESCKDYRKGNEQMWGAVVHEGDKQRQSDVFVIPKDLKELRIENVKIDLSEAVRREVESTPVATAQTQFQLPAAEAPSPSQTAPQQLRTDPVIGFTGAPTGAPTEINKTISYCMEGPEYQPGTTMFTDGTTGWTTQCAG
ncbi:hypothetical protein [Corynebacterium hindlerae]|uniref:hypothetical protein n=1 Tax=Corynebacterium hindlerae TaxID=699041 RepID=UPI0031B67276